MKTVPNATQRESRPRELGPSRGPPEREGDEAAKECFCEPTSFSQDRLGFKPFVSLH